MPRKGRGGARQGTPGIAYGNRTDLNQPISTVPGQEYGKATEQRDAQRAVPMASSPVADIDPSMAPPTPQGRPMAMPGSLPYIAPTSRPDEPVTAGLPTGPGPGPEALGATGPTFDQIIRSVASSPHASAVATQIANVARSLGY